jgi:hypothetical protein
MRSIRRLRVVLAHAAALLVAVAVFTATGGATTGGQAAPNAVPANTSPPTIAGEAREGQTLTASPGSWSGTTPIAYAYQWFRCGENLDNCAPIGGATNNTYTVAGADVAKRLLVNVTATNAEGSGTAQGSTGVVAPASGKAPDNSKKPEITGTAREGETLTASAGEWKGTEPFAFAYQWLRCDDNGNNCIDIAGATAQTYKLTSGDVGRTVRVRVTATNSAGSSSATTDRTAVIASLGTAPANTTPPTISGTPTDGQMLTATNGNWNGTAPTTYALQWQRCDANGAACVAIAGATGQTYQLSAADVSRTLRVAVTASNQAGTTQATSVPTAVIAQAAPPAPTGPEGQIKLPNGKTSIPVTSVQLPARLIVDGLQFTPNPVRSRQQPVTLRVHVSDTRGYVVRDVPVFARSTPLVTRSAGEQRTGTDGYATITMTPRANFPLRRGFNVQFFVRARKPGENLLAGVSTRRLTQVRTAR